MGRKRILRPMTFFDFIYELSAAIFVLGLPVFFVTWYLLRRLYRAGLLEVGIDHKTLQSKLKGIKKEKSESDDFLHRNWMKFGGGFYGMTAVTTLLLIELKDFFLFVIDFPGIAALLENGIVSLVVDIIVNQIQNFIVSAIWFSHWGEGGFGMVMWALIAYLGFVLGSRAAQRSLEQWQQQLDQRIDEIDHNKKPPSPK